MTKRPTKKEICSLKPGTFIVLRWKDADDSLAMILERPVNQKGDISLHCLHQNGTIDTHAVHTQVAVICYQMEWPKLLICLGAGGGMKVKHPHNGWTKQYDQE